MPANLPILQPEISDDYCFESWQKVARDLVGGAVVQLDNSGWSVLLKQDTTPTAAQRAYLWLNTSDDRTYRWESSVSKWVSKHYSPASGSERRIWSGSLNELKTFDGGEDAAVGTASGPMWEEDVDFAGRSPMGVGAIQNANPAKSLTIGEAYGDGAHTMTIEELVEHTHETTLDGGGNDGGTHIHTAGDDNGVSPVIPTSATGESEPFSIIHPVRAVYIIRRTARVYYAAT